MARQPSPVRRPPGRRPPGRRQQILDAAAPLFARRGFHGVSVDDLGAASGVSGPALYRHFRAKEDILAELLVGVSGALLDGALARVAGAGTGEGVGGEGVGGEAGGEGLGARDAAGVLEALVAWHVDFALDNPDVITVQTRDLASLPPRAAGAVRSLQHRYVALWAGVVDARTGCGEAAAVAACHAAFGLVNSTPHSARLPRADMARLLSAMALAALDAAGGRAPRRAPGGD